MHLSRDRWTRVPRPATLAPFVGSELRGVAVHWTGSEAPVRASSLAASIRHLEQTRVFHVSPEPVGRGWSDIAYNYCTDQDGRLFELRGASHRSAANGDQPVNRSHGAFLFLIGRGEAPSEAALAAFGTWRRTIWLNQWPTATSVVGHRDLHATECPGDTLHSIIRAGSYGSAHQEDDVPLSDDDVERVARRTAELISGIGARFPVLVTKGTGEAQLPDGRDIASVPVVLRRILDAVTEK